MFCTHIYFNGNCKEAIELYKKAFNAKVLTIMNNTEKGKENLIIHSEIEIHSQKLMMNDFGDNEGNIKQNGYQLVVQFNDVPQLESAYKVLSEKGNVLSPMQPTDYSPCVVRFNDMYGTRWAFYV